MKHVDIRHIVVFAALVLGSTANAATYDYTAHYDDIHRPALAKAQVDPQLQEDTATCDSAVGVQRATPSVNYRSCMLQHGWRYGFVTRAPDSADAGACRPVFQ